MIWPAHCRIDSSVIVSIRSVIGVSNRMIISSVGSCIHLAESYGRPDKKPVKWPVYVKPVKGVDITCTIVEIPKIVIEYSQTAYPSYKSISIPDIDATNLTNSTVIVVVNRYIFYLNNGTVIVVLNKRIVIKT